MRGMLTDPKKTKNAIRSPNPGKAEAERTAQALALVAAGQSPDGPNPKKLRDKAGKSIFVDHRNGSPLIAALRHLGVITPAEKRVIVKAGVDGFSVQQATEFWTYQLCQLEKAKAAGLEPRAYLLGLGQLMTAAVKLAELGVRGGEGQGMTGPVQFTMNLQQTVFPQGYIQTEPDEISGDTIEVG